MTDAIARRSLARVIVHARRTARRRPAHIPLDELISAGLLGAVEALLRFDPERSESLEAFLDHRIRGAILDALRRAAPPAAHDPGVARGEPLSRALGLGLARFRSRVAHFHTRAVKSRRRVLPD